MTIEGLGKKFQEARLARGLTLDEAARMTKIRPARLAEIEAEDFSQFPSLAYAKGFLLIYGKFLDVDVTPYLEAFEGSEHVTVDGYSYLQDNPAPSQSAETATKKIIPAPAAAPPATAAPAIAAASPPASKEPEVRRAEPVRPEDLAKAAAANSSPAAEPGGPNRVAIRPLKKTYVKVVVDNEEVKPAFERWIS